jgi:hypothetical protein
MGVRIPGRRWLTGTAAARDMPAARAGSAHESLLALCRAAISEPGSARETHLGPGHLAYALAMPRGEMPEADVVRAVLDHGAERAMNAMRWPDLRLVYGVNESLWGERTTDLLWTGRLMLAVVVDLARIETLLVAAAQRRGLHYLADPPPAAGHPAPLITLRSDDGPSVECSFVQFAQIATENALDIGGALERVLVRAFGPETVASP